MKEKDIIQSINKTLNARSIDLLDEIKARPYEPMSAHDAITVQPLEKEKPKSSWFNPFLRVALSMAVMVLLFVGYQALKPAPVVLDSLIYLDVNPSIIYKVDKQGKVYELEAKNTFGQKIIDQVSDYQNKDIEVVVELILDEMVKQDLMISKMPTVLVSVINQDQDVANRQMKLIDRTIENYFKGSSVHPLVINQKFAAIDETVKSQADRYQISESKLNFILRVHQVKDDKSIEALSKMSLNELIDYLLEADDDLDEIDPRLNKMKEDKKQGKEPVIPPTEVIEKPTPVEPPKQPSTAPETRPSTTPETQIPEKPKPVITTKTIETTKPIEYSTQQRNDDSLEKGTTKVVQEGKNGIETTVIEITYSDGKEISRKTISKTVTREPIPKIVLVGTKEAPKPSLRLSQKAARDMVTNRFGGVISKIEYTYNETNPLYKGEAIKDNQKVVFEINARTKAFVKWDTGGDNQFNDFTARYRTPSLMDQAVNAIISRSQVSHTFVQKIDFKWDTSEPMFVGEAFSKDTKYVFEMDARNLSFLKFTKSTGDETWSKQYSDVRSK